MSPSSFSIFSRTNPTSPISIQKYTVYENPSTKSKDFESQYHDTNSSNPNRVLLVEFEE